MDTITYSAARASLATTMDKVCQDHEPLIITRSGQQSVVMLSLDLTSKNVQPPKRPAECTPWCCRRRGPAW